MAIKISDIGRFNRRISVEKVTVIQLDDGNIEESWSHIYDTWANITDQKGMRDQIELQNVNVNSYIVQIRYTPSHEISKNIRILYEGVYHIVHGQPLQFTQGRKTYYQFIMTAQV